jgi:hypothetical protein
MAPRSASSHPSGGTKGALLAGVGGAAASGFLLPVPGVPSDNPPGLAEALWALPGALLALAASYAYGAHSDRIRGIDRS